jgi:hypothetical protein
VTRFTSFDQNPEQRTLALPCVGERIFVSGTLRLMIHSKFAEAGPHAVLSQVTRDRSWLVMPQGSLFLPKWFVRTVSPTRFRARHPPRLIWLHRCLVRNYEGLRILLSDQQNFPGGTLFRCCMGLVRVFQCETLAKRDRQLS